MRLTPNNIPHYLIDKGFLDSNKLVSGNFMVSQTQSRNSIFHVYTGDEKGLFIKQLQTINSENQYLMQKDATAHYLIHQNPIYSQTRKFTPNYYGFDPNHNVLVTEFHQEAQNIYENSLSNSRISVEHGRIIAEILASYHKDISELILDNYSLQFFNHIIPWSMNISEMPFQKDDPVFSTIQKDEFLCSELDKLRVEWSSTSLIHGDIKMVNFIVVKEGSTESLRIVDWETADIGDPLWDVAGLFQSYLTTWTTGKSNQNATEGKIWTIENVRSVINMFWKTYSETKEWDKKEQSKALEKTMRYTAARLLQTAKEANVISPQQLLPHIAQLIQLAQNIFKSPLNASKDLLGITV